MRRHFDLDSEEEDATRFHVLTDVQFSVRTILENDAGVFERVNYTPYGVGEHHPGSDVDNDRDADSTDANAISAANGASIGQSGYLVECDLDRNGTINIFDVVAMQYHSEIPDGWISIGGLNDIGYDGYVFGSEINTYHVRFRWYDPEIGRFIDRDPAGYIDGINLYRYGRSNPIRYVDRNGWQAEDPNEDPESAEAKEKCEDWAARESERDQSWLKALEDCPCELDMTDPKKPKVKCEDTDKWKSPEDDSGRWSPYHPNAKWQVRGKAQEDGSGQQCTYDENGKLITDGPSAGTPDLHSPTWSWVSIGGGLVKSGWGWATPWKEGRNNKGYVAGDRVGRHRKHDVLSFVACRDAGMLDVYFKYRPPNKGKKPDGSPCDQNEVDKKDDDGNWIIP